MPIDNYGLYDIEERRLMRGESHRPKCDRCGEPIWDEYAYRIGDLLICESCVENAREYIDEEDY